MELSELKAFTSSVIKPLLDEEPENNELPQVTANPSPVEQSSTVQTSGRGEVNMLWTSETFAKSSDCSNRILLERTLDCAFERIADNFGIVGKCFYVLKLGNLHEGSFYETVIQKYGVSRSTVANLVAVYQEYCNADGTIMSYYRGYSLSQLVEMLSLSYQDKLKITKDMTVKQIRAYKKQNAQPLKLASSKQNTDLNVLDNQVSITELEVSPHEPQDTSGTVYIHFSDEIEFTRWYYENFNNVEMYPITISYNKN